MGKCRYLLYFLMMQSTLLWSFEKLDSKYQVVYGNPSAEVKVIEYFSFSCPKCVSTFVQDFAAIKMKYIDTNKVVWVFHPDPADLLTLQGMVCLEQLQEREKRLFFEVMMKHLKEEELKKGSLYMKCAMDVLNTPIPNLEKMEFLEKTESLQKAFQYLKQKDVISRIPTVEINGRIYDEYPSRKFLEKTLDTLLSKETNT